MVKTGKAPITMMTYLAIMSISLIVNLPGLAVAPMEGRLKEILHAPELEVQLLTTLPNFIIIPFVLLSGKLSEARHKIPIIVGALILYSGCAIWYLFAGDMTSLIVISCLLGCGAGLLIPFSTGLIAETFAGKIRMKQMGWQSGISNSTVVIATFAVGWLIQGKNWHLPFVVYLAAAIPLIFSLWLKNVPGINRSSKQEQNLISEGEAQANSEDPNADLENKPEGEPKPDEKPFPKSSNGVEVPAIEKPHNNSGFNMGRIWSLIGVYFLVTFTSIAITNYSSQLTVQYGWPSNIAGDVTSVFFLLVLIPGYILTWFVKRLRGGTFLWTALMLVVGLGLFVFFHEKWAMFVGAGLTGLGYGICQPMLYDKASYTVSNPEKLTMALAFVLTANYLAIAIEPFIISGISGLFHIKNENLFAFILSFGLVVAYTILILFTRKTFAFSVDKSYYEEGNPTQTETSK
ncbi:MAG: MFS transporter [Muribaculaceae bacterium]|nr:MFS transporter [Muribaculaceae bacterium]